MLSYLVFISMFYSTYVCFTYILCRKWKEEKFWDVAFIISFHFILFYACVLNHFQWHQTLSELQLELLFLDSWHKNTVKLFYSIVFKSIFWGISRRNINLLSMHFTKSGNEVKLFRNDEIFCFWETVSFTCLIPSVFCTDFLTGWKVDVSVTLSSFKHYMEKLAVLWCK